MKHMPRLHDFWHKGSSVEPVTMVWGIAAGDTNGSVEHETSKRKHWICTALNYESNVVRDSNIGIRHWSREIRRQQCWYSRL
jgi:hypothetical protein